MRIYVAILITAFMLLMASCASDDQTSSPSRPNFKSYKDIPGVTKEEISAIEHLKQVHPEFVYGVNITMEAFFSEDGKVEGFAKLFCERLSQLYGIKFVPRIYGWDEMNKKLEAGEIDFTGELSFTPERQEKYIM